MAVVMLVIALDVAVHGHDSWSLLGWIVMIMMDCDDLCRKMLDAGGGGGGGGGGGLTSRSMAVADLHI